MSIQPYVGPNSGSNNGAIVALGAAQEITLEEYERRQKEVWGLTLAEKEGSAYWASYVCFQEGMHRPTQGSYHQLTCAVSNARGLANCCIARV